MFANRKLVSQKSPVDHKLLMQIRNGHLNEGFNSRKSSSASTKPISKYNLLHSYFECNFSGEYSKRIAQELKRQIKSCNKYKQLEPTFIDSVRQKIHYVHNYNIKVAEVTFAYPLSNEFVELLIEYVLIESRALYRRQDHIDVRMLPVQDRILRILMHIFNAFFESKMVPPKEIFEKTAKAIINIFIEIKRDYGVNNKLMENMTIKLLKRTGLFEKIEALKGKNLPCPLDTFLTDHAYSDIYKSTITSDYGTDEGFHMDDDIQAMNVQSPSFNHNIVFQSSSKQSGMGTEMQQQYLGTEIVDDDVVDVTAIESNKIKGEDACTSPLTKSVLTFCLDDSDFASDEETCYFAEEVKTSKRSLEFQKQQRHQDKVSFRKRNHRPMYEIKTEAIKLDMSEECNFSDTNSKPVNSDVSHSEANLISNKAIDIKCGIQCHNQSTIENRNMTKPAIINTEIIEISDEETEVETYEQIPEENAGSNITKEAIESSLVKLISQDAIKGSQSQVEDSNIETTNALDSPRSCKSHEIDDIASSKYLHDVVISVAETVAVGESNPRVVVVDSVEQPTTDSYADICPTKTTTIIDPSLHKMNYEINEVLSEFDNQLGESNQEEIKLHSGKDVDFVSKEARNINQSNTPDVSDFKKSSTEVSDIPNPIVSEINRKAKDSTEENSDHSSEMTEVKKPAEIVVFQSTQPLQDTNLVEKSKIDAELFNKNSELEIKIESADTHEVHEVEYAGVDKPQKSCNQEKVELNIDGTFSNENSDHSDELAEDKKLKEIIETSIQSTQPLEESVIDKELSIKDPEFVIAVENGSDDTQSSELDVGHILSNVSVDGHDGEQISCNQENVDSNINETCPNKNSDYSAEMVEVKKPAEIVGVVFQSTQPLQDTNLVEKSKIDAELFNKNSELEIENESDDTHEVHEVEYAGVDKPQKSCNQEKVELNIDGTFSNENSDHSDELAENKKLKEIIETSIQSTQPLEESVIDKELSIKGPEFVIAVENGSDDTQSSELDVGHILSNVSVDGHDGEQISCNQENVDSNINETCPNKNSDYSAEMAEVKKPAEIVGVVFQSTQPLQDTNLVEKSKIDAELFNKNSELEIEIESDDTHEVEYAGVDKPQKTYNQEKVELNIDGTFSNENSDHSDELAENKKLKEIIETSIQSTQPLEESVIDKELSIKGPEFVIAVENGSDDTQSSELDVGHILSNVSVDGHDGEQISCNQENVDSNINETYPNKNSYYSAEMAEVKKPAEIVGVVFQSTQPLQDTNLVEKSKIDAELFNKNSELEIEIESDDTHEVHEVEYAGVDKPQKTCNQEKVELNIDGTFSNENSHHSDELAEYQKPKEMIEEDKTLVKESNIEEHPTSKVSELAIEVGSDGAQSELAVMHTIPTEIIEEAFQTTQHLQDTTLLEKSNIDITLFNKDSDFAMEVEVRSDDAQSELDVKHIIPNISIECHDDEQRSGIQEHVKSKSDGKFGTFPNENSEIRNEYAETSVKERVELSDHKVEEKAKIGENPTDLATVEKLCQKPNEHLFEFHNEFACEVEIGTEAIQHKIVKGDSFIEDQLKKSATEKHDTGSHVFKEQIPAEKAGSNITKEANESSLVKSISQDAKKGSQSEVEDSNIETTNALDLPRSCKSHKIDDIASSKYLHDIEISVAETVAVGESNPRVVVVDSVEQPTTDSYADICPTKTTTIIDPSLHKMNYELNEVLSEFDNQLGESNQEEIKLLSGKDVDFVSKEVRNINQSNTPDVSDFKKSSTEVSDIPNNSENNVLEGTKIEAKAILRDSIENLISQSTVEIISKQNDKEKPDDALCKKSFSVTNSISVPHHTISREEVEKFENIEENTQLHEVHEVEYAGVDKLQKTCNQEKVELNIDGTFSNENLDHSDELAEYQKPIEMIEEDETLVKESNIEEHPTSKVSELAIEVGSDGAQSELDVMHTIPTEIIEEAFQTTQHLQDTSLLEKSNIDITLFNKDSDFAMEVEVRSDDAQSELDVKYIIPNISIECHDGEQRSGIQEHVKSKSDGKFGTFPNENSEIRNEYAETSVKERVELSDHKVEEKAKIGENPTDLAIVEKLCQKPNEHLFEFHNEFACEVEIGTEAANSDTDISIIGELRNVADQHKIVKGDSFIEDQLKKSATEKHLTGSPVQNVRRTQENLHTSIITESQDSGIASNSGSSDGQEYQSLQTHLESEVDLSLRLRSNGVDNFAHETVPQEDFYPLDVLAGVAAKAAREIVIEEKKPLRRGRSSKPENGNANELSEKVMFNQKKQPSSSKVSKCNNKIEQTPKPRTNQTAKKVVQTSVNVNIRVTRSSHLKNSTENVETSFKPHDFLSVKKLIPPANKIYADRVVDVNVTSEDSNDSESNKLMIDEGASAKLKYAKPEPLLDSWSENEIVSHNTEVKEVNTKSKDINSKSWKDQWGECEVDRGINDLSKILDHQIQVDDVDKKKSEYIFNAERSIYDEDSVDEELHFCYEPNLEPKISVQQNNEDFSIAEEHQQFPSQEKKVASVKNNKISFESSKPFRTKAERKAYNQQGPNPYISIERLNVSTTENNVPIQKQKRSNSLDIGLLRNIVSKSKRLHSKENLKNPPSIEVEPEEKTGENTESDIKTNIIEDIYKTSSVTGENSESEMITNINRDIYKTELTEDNVPFSAFPENSERNRKVNEPSDFDEIPLSERIGNEARECLAETSLPEEIAIKSKLRSKKTTKKKGATKINKISGKPDVHDTYKAAAEPENEESDSLSNQNILQEKKPTAVFHSLSTIDNHKVDDIQTKIENLEENSNRNYYTLPKLRRKSMSKDNLSRSVSSATILVSTSDIKDEDVKCMPPPKLRGKSSANGERFTEQNTKLKWKCKNTVSQTTEKLLKKLSAEIPTVDVEKSLSQKPLFDTFEQPPYKFCERNLAVSDLPPKSECSNLLNPLLKKEIISHGILIENISKSTGEDSLCEYNDKSNDIVYDLSLKPQRKVPNISNNGKASTVTEVELIPIITEYKNALTLDVFDEQEKDKEQFDSSSNEKLTVYESNFVSAQIPKNVQKDDVSFKSKKSLEAESIKPDIDHVDIEIPFHLPSCPSEDVTVILSNSPSPEENKGKHKSSDEFSSPSKMKLETAAKLDLLNNKLVTSAIIDRDFSSKNNLQDLNAEAFKNIISSDTRNEAEECEKSQTDIATSVSKTKCDQKHQNSISKTPELPNESNKTAGLPNIESECNVKSVIKTKLEKRKYHDSSEDSKQKKRRKTRMADTVNSTATVDAENGTDANLIEAVGPGFEGENIQENEEQKMKTAANSLGIGKMQVNHKQKVSLFPLDASKSPLNFVNVIKIEELQSKKTDGASDKIGDEVAYEEIKDEVANEEIKDEVAKEEIKDEAANEKIKEEVTQTGTGSTPELKVCLDFYSKTSQSQSDLSIQKTSPVVQKQVQSEESTTEVSINSGEIEEDLVVSLEENSNSNSKLHSSGRKKIDTVKIVKHTSEKVKRKVSPRSKPQAHTAKDGVNECDSTHNLSTRLNASRIISEIKEPHGKKINEVNQVSEGKPLQKISKRPLSRLCTDDVDEGMAKLGKKLNKTGSELPPRSYSHGGIEIVQENLQKSEKQKSSLETRLSLISRSESNIHEDILKVNDEEIVIDQNNKSQTLSRLSPRIEEVCETSKPPPEQVPNQLISVQKPDSGRIVTIADTVILSSQAPQTGDLKNYVVPDNICDSVVLKITQKDAHSNNENQSSADFLNNAVSSCSVSIEETETIQSSDNINKTEVTSFKDDKSSKPDITYNAVSETSFEAKYSPSEGKEISHDLDSSVVNSQMYLPERKEIHCVHYSAEKNLKENEKFCGYGCLNNIKQSSFLDNTEMSDIRTLDIDLQNSKELHIESSTIDYNLITESESISVSNEIELGPNVVEDKRNNESVDDYVVANNEVTVTEGKSELVAKNAPAQLRDLLKEEMPKINRDLLGSGQELSEAEVVKINVHEEPSQNSDLPNTYKRKRTIASEPESEKPAVESNAGKSIMRELTIPIDNSHVAKYSLHESPRKRERKSIESDVIHLKGKERENCSSFVSTIPVTIGSVKSNLVSSTEKGCNGDFADLNSPLWLKSDEIPDFHSEVVVSSDQPTTISSSLSQEGYINQDFVDANCTMNYENHPIKQGALGKTTLNIEQVASRNKDLKPLHFNPVDDMFVLGDSRQCTNIEESSMNSSLSEESSTDGAINITKLNPTESSANDANVEETFQNLANLRHFGTPAYLKMQNASSFVSCNSDSRSESVSPTTITSINTSDISLNYQDISPCKMSIGITPTSNLSSTESYQHNQNILGQISRVNSFITAVSGSPNEITGIIPVSKQADFSHSFKNIYEGNNSDHSYHNPADPVMSIAGEDIFPKGMSDASSELNSNDDPLRGFELSDVFSDFLNTKQVSEEKDSGEKDESNQNDDYKLRIDNETITQNLVDISRSRQSNEINQLYYLIDNDKMDPDYPAEPSRDDGLWEATIESEQSAQKVIVLPNNHCLTSPFDINPTDLLDSDQSTQKMTVEPNDDCLTPTFNISHTDLYTSFNVSPPRPQCYNPVPPVKSESVDSSLNEGVCANLPDSGNNSSTLGTSKIDPKKDCLGDLKKLKITKRSMPKKIEKDQKEMQPDILPTRRHSRTKPSQWTKPNNNSKVNQLSSSSPVEKLDTKVDYSINSSKEVVSTDNLLKLPSKSARTLHEKPIVIRGITETKTTGIASTKIANTSVSVKEQTRQTISKPDTPKSKAEIPITQPTVRNLNNITNVNANIVKVSKSSDAGLLPRVARVTSLKHDHKLPLRKLPDEYNLGEVNRNFGSESTNGVVKNIADNVKSGRQRVATNLYSSPLPEKNVKRKKAPTNVETKTAVNSPGPGAKVVEGQNSRRSQNRDSSRSVEPTSEAEGPLPKRFKAVEKTPQDLHPKPAGSKYSVNYSIERILGKDNNSANESRHTNEGPVKDCREREKRDLKKISSGRGNRSVPEVGNTEGSITQDAFDMHLRRKNEHPSDPPREHLTFSKNRNLKPDPASKINERGFNKSNRESIPRDGSTRMPSAPHYQTSQERNSSAGNKRHPTYQGHSRGPYPPEQRRSSGGYYPSTGSSRQSNDKQSGISSSRSNVSPRVNTLKEEEWTSLLVDKGYLQPLTESSPLFQPQKSPRDKL